MRLVRSIFTHLSTSALAVTILAGAFVHATGSGLACPDWPLCLGTFFPEMTGAVLYEHSHRLIAGTTGIIVWITGFLYLFSDVDRLQKITAGALMALIVVQAVLGGLTVLYQLPGWISTAHFLLAHLTFAGMLYLSWRAWNAGNLYDLASYTQNDKILGVLTGTTLFFQMGLGAWLRHIGSKGPALGPVCQDFPWCQPEWIQFMTEYYLSIYWFHRYMAVAVVVLFGLLSIREFGKRGLGSVEFNLSFLGVIVVLAQIILGLLSVRASLSVLFVMLHTAGALTLLSIVLWINFQYFAGTRS